MSELTEKLEAHLRALSPHIAEREQSKLLNLALGELRSSVEELDRLRGEVAMLREALRLEDARNWAVGIKSEEPTPSALTAASETAKQYENAIKEKALREFGEHVKQTVNHSDIDNHDFEDGKEAAANMAIEIALSLEK